MSASGRFDIATSKRFVWKSKPVTIDDLATPRNFSLHPAAENCRRDSHRDPASSFLQKHQHKVPHRWKERPRGQHSSGKMDRERGRDRRLVPPFHYPFISFLARSTRIGISAHHAELRSIEETAYLLCIFIGKEIGEQRAGGCEGVRTRCHPW
jgi:hypothetical protein